MKLGVVGQYLIFGIIFVVMTTMVNYLIGFSYNGIPAWAVMIHVMVIFCGGYVYRALSQKWWGTTAKPKT